jgi:hypothetical protein
MKNLVRSAVATMFILVGSGASTVDAAPLNVHGSIARQASFLPIVQIRGQQHENRGRHYGWSRGRHNPHRRGW